MNDTAFSDIDLMNYGKIPSGTAGDSRKKDKKAVLLKVFLCILGFLAFIEVIAYKFVVPCFSEPVMTYSGISSLTPDYIAVYLGDLSSASWFKFDTHRAVNHLNSISCIESVSVDKIFPNKIDVKIKERIPVAKSIITENGRSKSIQIDENGVLFTLQHGSPSADASVPLISGLPIENLQEGMRIPAKYRSLMSQIAEIKKLPQKYFVAISEIQVVAKEYGNYELVIFPAHEKIRVLTDRRLNEEQLQIMMVVLDVVNSIEKNVSEIDLRYGSVSYRCKDRESEELHLDL